MQNIFSAGLRRIFPKLTSYLGKSSNIMLAEESKRLSQPHSRRREENEDQKTVVQSCVIARVCFSVGCVWSRSHNRSTSGCYRSANRSDDGGSNGSANRGSHRSADGGSCNGSTWRSQHG